MRDRGTPTPRNEDRPLAKVPRERLTVPDNIAKPRVHTDKPVSPLNRVLPFLLQEGRQGETKAD